MKIIAILATSAAIYFGAFDDSAKTATDALSNRQAQIEAQINGE